MKPKQNQNHRYKKLLPNTKMKKRMREEVRLPRERSKQTVKTSEKWVTGARGFVARDRDMEKERENDRGNRAKKEHALGIYTHPAS